MTLEDMAKDNSLESFIEENPSRRREVSITIPNPDHPEVDVENMVSMEYLEEDKIRDAHYAVLWLREYFGNRGFYTVIESMLSAVVKHETGENTDELLAFYLTMAYDLEEVERASEVWSHIMSDDE